MLDLPRRRIRFGLFVPFASSSVQLLFRELSFLTIFPAFASFSLLASL
jgi:hypothetical protein